MFVVHRIILRLTPEVKFTEELRSRLGNDGSRP